MSESIMSRHRQQAEQLRLNCESLGLQALQLAGEVLRKQSAYVALRDDRGLAQALVAELELTQTLLKHLVLALQQP